MQEEPHDSKSQQAGHEGPGRGSASIMKPQPIRNCRQREQGNSPGKVTRHATLLRPWRQIQITVSRFRRWVRQDSFLGFGLKWDCPGVLLRVLRRLHGPAKMTQAPPMSR